MQFQSETSVPNTVIPCKYFLVPKLSIDVDVSAPFMNKMFNVEPNSKPSTMDLCLYNKQANKG